MKKMLIIGIVLLSTSIRAMDEKLENRVNEKEIPLNDESLYITHSGKWLTPYYTKDGHYHLYKNPSDQWVLLAAPPLGESSKVLTDEEASKWKEKMRSRAEEALKN